MAQLRRRNDGVESMAFLRLGSGACPKIPHSVSRRYAPKRHTTKSRAVSPALIACRSLIVIRDPLGDRALQCGALMPALQFPEGLRAHMCNEWLLSFSHPVVTSHVKVFSEIPAGAVTAPEIPGRARRFLGMFPQRLLHRLRH